MSRAARSAALLAASALAAAPALAADPAAAELAAALKTSMVKTYKPTVPRLQFRRVTCTLTADRKSGRCQARFAYPVRHMNGVFQVKAAIDRRTGGVRWQATAVSCTSSRTGRKTACVI